MRNSRQSNSAILALAAMQARAAANPTPADSSATARVWLGIDPGTKSGGLALVCESRGLLAYARPPMMRAKTVQRLDVVDARQWAALLRRWMDQFGVSMLAGVQSEELTSRFRDGRMTAESFGRLSRAAATLECVAQLACQDPIRYERPVYWKKVMGLTARKGDSVDLARTIWPSLPKSFGHDLAEAALLALFGLKYSEPVKRWR